MRRNVAVVLAALGCVTIVASACSTVVAGKPNSTFADPYHVAGMTAVDGDSGLRANAPASTRVVIGSDGGEVDGFGRAAVSDIEEFWSDAYGRTFRGEFRPVAQVMSWDSNGENTAFCGGDTVGLVSAGYCVADDTIGWDRGVLLPKLRAADGDMAVGMVLAHEYGHAIQRQSGLTDGNTPTLVVEQQADCLAGVYMRWVAEGHSARFTLSTGDGLNNLLAAMIEFRDPLLNERGTEAIVNPHGSAFERVSAFQSGFTDGASSCAAIDQKEVEQRRGELPTLLQDSKSGDVTITEQSVRDVVDAMNAAFHPDHPPNLAFGQVGTPCPDSHAKAPAVYCPARNEIVVDLPALQTLGNTPADDGPGLATGDNTGYSIILSRYVMALQRARGLALDDAAAALRTACLTGVATAELAKGVTTPTGSTFTLTAGDLDEAVSGLLVNGFAASDVNGETVPAGFSRIDAFRIGVLGTADRCFTRFG